MRTVPPTRRFDYADSARNCRRRFAIACYGAVATRAVIAAHTHRDCSSLACPPPAPWTSRSPWRNCCCLQHLYALPQAYDARITRPAKFIYPARFFAEHHPALLALYLLFPQPSITAACRVSPYPLPPPATWFPFHGRTPCFVAYAVRLALICYYAVNSLYRQVPRTGLTKHAVQPFFRFTVPALLPLVPDEPRRCSSVLKYPDLANLPRGLLLILPGFVMVRVTPLFYRRGGIPCGFFPALLPCRRGQNIVAGTREQFDAFTLYPPATYLPPHYRFWFPDSMRSVGDLIRFAVSPAVVVRCYTRLVVAAGIVRGLCG